MRFASPAAAAFAATLVVSGYARGARAQEAPGVTEPAEPIAPIEIVASPSAEVPTPSRVEVNPRTLGPPRGGMNVGRYLPSYEREPNPTVLTRTTSLGAPVEIAFVPASERLPRDSQLEYLCRTPCEVALPAGRYHLVARSEFGRFRIYVDVGAHARFFVTPRESRALAYGLLIPGIITGVAGFLTLVEALVLSTSPYSSSGLAPVFIAGAALSVGGAAFTTGGAYFLPGTGGSVRLSPDGPPVRSNARATISASIAPIRTGGAIAVATVRF